MKIKTIKVILILLLSCILYAIPIYSQKLNPETPAIMEDKKGYTPSEEIYLHVDRNKYIAGEEIWFSIYVSEIQTHTPFAGNTVAYIEVLNPWNAPVVQKRFLISGGTGEGNIALADTLSSGTYIIRAYTSLMKNYMPDGCFMQVVEIYNPFKGEGFWRRKDSTGDSAFPLEAYSAEGQSDIITITSDTLFSRRQKVKIDIDVSNRADKKDRVTGISISVTPSNVSSDERDVITRRTLKLSSGNRNSEKYNSENGVHFLPFSVRYRENKSSDSTKFLFMSVQGKVADFRYARRDSSGRFTFVLPIDNIARNLIIQPEYATGNMILETISSFSCSFPSTECFKGVLNEKETGIFSTLSFNYQASKIYGIRVKKEIPEDNTVLLQKRRFYGIPEMEIHLDDFIKLPNIQEVFFELVPGVIIRAAKQGGYEIKIINPLTGIYYEEKPLVMIDGVIINDLTVLVDLNPELVERVEVVKTPYLIGDMIIHGIVNVLTRTGNFSNVVMPEYAVLMPYRVVEKPIFFSAPDYTDELERQGRTPDLRNTVYWNPSVKTGNDGKAEIEFWTSDVPGKYTISLHGILSSGKKFISSRTYSVK